MLTKVPNEELRKNLANCIDNLARFADKTEFSKRLDRLRLASINSFEYSSFVISYDDPHEVPQSSLKPAYYILAKLTQIRFHLNQLAQLLWLVKQGKSNSSSLNIFKKEISWESKVLSEWLLLNHY